MKCLPSAYVSQAQRCLVQILSCTGTYDSVVPFTTETGHMYAMEFDLGQMRIYIRRNLCIREGVRIRTPCVYAPTTRVNAPTTAYKHICVYAASGA